MSLDKHLSIAKETALWFNPHHILMSEKDCRIIFGRVEVVVINNLFIPGQWDIEISWPEMGSIDIPESENFSKDLRTAIILAKTISKRFEDEKNSCKNN
jgi:hypothetical protein